MAGQETIATIGDTSYLINDLNARVRLLEERYMQLRENLELINDNMVEEQKEVLKRVKGLSEEIKKSKKDVEELNSTINHIIKEVSLFARKDTLKVLEKYINMWNPMKFTTEEDVMQIIKRELKKSLKEFAIYEEDEENK
ncbi:hypothetical protein J4414_02890 [Candidatus Woesearchaeota archaeon]|nr:hypothetical protein [Candidatus Woesearchaeota archaeon]